MMNCLAELLDDGAAQAAPLPALTSRIEDIVAARDAALAKVQEAAATLDLAYGLSK